MTDRRRYVRHPALLALAMLGLACATTNPARAAEAAPAASAPQPGHLLIIGGGERPPAVMRRFVELAGGPAAPILIVPTATLDTDVEPYYQAELARAAGATNVHELPVHVRADAMRPEVVKLVEGAAGIFFCGGDQARITAALLDTPVGDAILAAHRRGVPIGGSSAGAAIMGPLMITGNGDFTVVAPGQVEVTPGLGFLPGTLVDQHFLARGRLVRLLSAVLEHPDLVGIGIDEETAALVRPDGTFEVLGRGWVIVYDPAAAAVRRVKAPPGGLRQVEVTADGPGADPDEDAPVLPPAPTEAFAATDVRLHVLVAGDVFELATRTVRPGAAAAAAASASP